MALSICVSCRDTARLTCSVANNGQTNDSKSQVDAGSSGEVPQDSRTSRIGEARDHRQGATGPLRGAPSTTGVDEVAFANGMGPDWANPADTPAQLKLEDGRFQLTIPAGTEPLQFAACSSVYPATVTRAAQACGRASRQSLGSAANYFSGTR